MDVYRFLDRAIAVFGSTTFSALTDLMFIRKTEATPLSSSGIHFASRSKQDWPQIEQ
jgi:hypothetical protein